MEERPSAQEESTREAQGGIADSVVLVQDEALKLNRRPLSRSPQKRDSDAEERFAARCGAVHGAGTEVEFACTMNAFVYTIGAMVPVVRRPRQRGRGGPEVRAREPRIHASADRARGRA